MLLLQSVCRDLPAAVVIRDSSREVYHSDTFLPGGYFLDSDLTITWSIRDITPVSDIGAHVDADVIDSLVEHALESCARMMQFRVDLAQRDQVCVLSGRGQGIVCSHIVSHAWLQNDENRDALLPDSIVDRLKSLQPNEVNDRRNGLILSPGLAVGFDTGNFTIIVNTSNQYEVVALDSAYLNFDGFLLYAGRERDAAQDMHPDLLSFHTSTSVLRECVPWEEPDAAYFDYRGELEDIKQMIYGSSVNGGEFVAGCLTWDMVERFVREQ
jgi:hypothetical protein